MMPASATGTVLVILYAWFATFGFVMGLVVALVCFHLATEPAPVEGLQEGSEESGPQEKPAVRVASTQHAGVRWTIFGEDSALPVPRPIALRRSGVEVWPYWSGSLGDCREVDSTHRVDVADGQCALDPVDELQGSRLHPQGGRGEKSGRKSDAHARKTGVSKACG